MIRTQKADANFRTIGWLLVSAFSKKEDLPKNEGEWWPLDIDQMNKKVRKAKTIPKANRISQEKWEIFINRMK